MIPLWPNAITGGHFAGFNMAGNPVVNEGANDANAVNVFELPIPADGSPHAAHDETLFGEHAGTRVKIYLDDDAVVGFNAIGTVRAEEMNIGAYNMPEAQREEIRSAFTRILSREGAGLEGSGIFYPLLRRQQVLTEEMRELIDLGDERAESGSDRRAQVTFNGAASENPDPRHG
jgi:hypothetical protein